MLPFLTHINNGKINGFAIDEYNVHKLEEGKKQGICPVVFS
jgi:hypothetical protein